MVGARRLEGELRLRSFVIGFITVFSSARVRRALDDGRVRLPAMQTFLQLQQAVYLCVRILLYLCPLHACPHTPIYVSTYSYIRVRILLYMCPQAGTPYSFTFNKTSKNADVC